MTRTRSHGSTRRSNHKSGQLSVQEQQAKVRGLAAISRVRKGQSKTLSAAARAEGTSVRTIRKLLPAALVVERNGRIRVKAGDSYSAPVEVLTQHGPVVVNARGSRQREIAGRHRSVHIRVLRADLPKSALDEFRDVKIGGQPLLTNSERLFMLSKAGVLGQLDALYASPDRLG
ncbi:MAG: hypothetical protein ACJ71Q_17865 [Terriglobales bacterium]